MANYFKQFKVYGHRVTRSYTAVFLFMFLLGTSSYLSAQSVSGMVKSTNGDPVIGAAVVEKGTTNGTITDIDGKYTLKLMKSPSEIEVSYVGFATKVMACQAGDANMEVTLEEGSALNEVVVTALGITREKKTLTYAMDEVKGDNLTTFKETNVANQLQGRSAGVFVGRSGTGVGGSTRVTIRGNKSITDNTPLYVIDGVPMYNSNGGSQGGLFGGGIDVGDAISNINPEDIESMSILKGASAAALYGSGAGNGVILITTKKGKSGKPKINFSSNFVTESPFGIPEMQYTYGQTAANDPFSWGAKGNFNDHVSGFFQNGSTLVNSLSLSGGSENAQSYFSYSNTKSTGIIPGNSLLRHNFNFNQNLQFFDKKLQIGAQVNFINQDVDNRPAGGLYFNPLTGLYFLPRGLDAAKYESEYEVYNKDRNMNVQSWHADSDIQQNPWWIINRNLNQNIRNRVITGLNASYKFADWISLKLRGNVDKSFDDFDQKIYATTQGTLSHPNGRYAFNKTNGSLIYGDAILAITKDFSDKLSFNASLGLAHNTTQTYSLNVDSGTAAGLNFPNVFSLQNIKNPLIGTLNEGLRRLRTNSAFASAQLGYDNFLYFDVTGRNDWSSSLPGQSFFYPSFGLSTILSEKVKISGINYSKLRVSYAIVGSGVPAYLNQPIENRYSISGGNLVLQRVGVIPGTQLKPEQAKSFEVGLDIRAANNRLGIDLTYYKNNTINQFITIKAPSGTQFTDYLVNAGNIQNSGIEGLITYDIAKSSDFTWTSGLNFTKNVNKVISVHPNFDDVKDGPFPAFINLEGVNSYGMAIKKGGQFGDIYGVVFDRDAQGRIKLNSDGVPTKKEGAYSYLGNPNPKFMAGWMNEFKYKGVGVKFLIDGRFGGKVMSLSQAMYDLFGVSKATADARDAGGVAIDAVDAEGKAVTKIDAEKYYKAVGGRAGITEAYMYDATNIRLREFSVGFNLPKSIISGNGVFKKATVSLIGRNLFFLSKKAPFDPDVSFSTGVGLQGVDVLSLPTTRSYGASVSFDF